jgi:hypothetical protein
MDDFANPVHNAFSVMPTRRSSTNGSMLGKGNKHVMFKVPRDTRFLIHKSLFAFGHYRRLTDAARALNFNATFSFRGRSWIIF